MIYSDQDQWIAVTGTAPSRAMLSVLTQDRLCRLPSTSERR
eukprot:COSAG03_NODE_21754_length_299_cov_271.435000_1_plen_40_part_10